LDGETEERRRPSYVQQTMITTGLRWIPPPSPFFYYYFSFPSCAMLSRVELRNAQK
jgi:hypothetical protein